MLRLATAAVLAPLLWLTIKLAPAWAFCLAAGIVILGASWECYRMLRARGAEPFVGLGLVATAALLGSFGGWSRAVTPATTLAALVMAASLLAMARRPSPERMLDTIVHTAFPVVFVGLTLGYVLALRMVPAADATDVVLLLFICVIFGDTAAYYIGSTFGRRRLAPAISPRKSWEGAAGALVGAVIGALVAHFWFYTRLPLAHALAIGVLLGAAGLLGDLAESMVKRACGVKDSSRLLPGHGGVLDRTDGLLFAAPVLYLYVRLFLGGDA